jgi:hypothetical protein
MTGKTRAKTLEFCAFLPAIGAPPEGKDSVAGTQINYSFAAKLVPHRGNGQGAMVGAGSASASHSPAA